MSWIKNQFEKKRIPQKLGVDQNDLDLIFTSKIDKSSFTIFYDYMYNNDGNIDIET